MARDATTRRAASILLVLAACGGCTLPALDPLASTTYAIYKPRNVLSAAGAASSGRKNYPTLTDIMVNAGVPPLPGHVGRLDAETSGLILVTANSLLLRAVLNWPDVLEAHGGRPLSKKYELLLAGHHPPESTALASIGEPLTHSRGGETFHSDAAVAVEHLGCFRDDDLAAGGYELIDRTDVERVALERSKLAVARRPAVSRRTGEAVPAYVPFQGELTRVRLTLKQGRHHQIRRLCRRAGLKLRHLRRVAVGPIELGDDAQPGDVRELSLEEKRRLCEECLPRLLLGKG